ncbi:unnamed protein product [Polarella glacialis]|uniref:Uncharacterized protein n=1 Tax=Polarella glacialis TaxID=89957 RepID=A0A813JBD3_POLGL|nr:unnamed protein product [Polarella glacialis]
MFGRTRRSHLPGALAGAGRCDLCDERRSVEAWEPRDLRQQNDRGLPASAPSAALERGADGGRARPHPTPNHLMQQSSSALPLPAGAASRDGSAAGHAVGRQLSCASEGRQQMQGESPMQTAGAGTDSCTQRDGVGTETSVCQLLAIA